MSWSINENRFWYHSLGRRTTTIIFHTVTGTSLALATLLNYFSGIISLTTICICFLSVSTCMIWTVTFLWYEQLHRSNLLMHGLVTQIFQMEMKHSSCFLLSQHLLGKCLWQDLLVFYFSSLRNCSPPIWGR